MQERKQKLKELEEHIKEGVRITKKIESVYRFLDDFPCRWSAQRSFPIEKISAFIVSRFLKREEQKVFFPKVTSFNDDYMLEDHIEIGEALEPICLQILSQTSWKWESYPLWDMLLDAREYADQKSKKETEWTDNMCKHFRSQFNGIVKKHMEQYRYSLQEIACEAETESIIPNNLLVYYNERIPQFFNILQCNLKQFSKEEQKEMEQAVSFMKKQLVTFPPFYERYVPDFPQMQTSEEIVYTYLEAVQIETDDETGSFMMRPEQFLIMYLLDCIMDYVEMKYPKLYLKKCVYLRTAGLP